MDDMSILSGLSAEDAARRLVGCELERTLNGKNVRVRIVETEAYDQTDAASHSHNGRTPRTEVMFGPAGILYVYFTYGMHYCCNVVVGSAGHGAAVLIRAVEPLSGESVLRIKRPVDGVSITNGPAKLCQALGIDTTMNGHDLTQEPLRLLMRPALPDEAVCRTTRIGISKAQDAEWRFYKIDDPYVSRLG